MDYLAMRRRARRPRRPIRGGKSYIRLYIHIYVCAHPYAYTQWSLYACWYPYMYVHTHIHINGGAYLYVFIHTHMYIRIHISTVEPIYKYLDIYLPLSLFICKFLTDIYIYRPPISIDHLRRARRPRRPARGGKPIYISISIYVYICIPI